MHHFQFWLSPLHQESTSAAVLPRLLFEPKHLKERDEEIKKKPYRNLPSTESPLSDAARSKILWNTEPVERVRVTVPLTGVGIKISFKKKNRLKRKKRLE